MRHSSDWKTNALTLLAALALAALYGSATALALWMLGFPEAVEIGGIVSTVTGILALVVALFIILYLVPTNNFEKLPHWIALPFAILAILAFYILIIPPTILTFGLFSYWLLRRPTDEEEN
ncbi:hypothetical protein HZB93_03770 [Candidatus Falkowbacteria bacterium]|nr:hypothetical protein [Candidatus Falkowbacteria bacterium]